MAASKSGGRGGGAKKPPARRRPTRASWADRLNFAREIARLKDDEKLTWPQVAERIGKPKTTCERLYRQLKATGDLTAPADAWAWVHRYEDSLVLALELVEETYRAAPAGSPQAIGAIKQLLAISKDRLELARWVGRTPRQLGALNAERAMQEMFREVAAIVERYDVPTAAVEEILDLAERRLSGPPTVIDASASAA